MVTATPGSSPDGRGGVRPQEPHNHNDTGMNGVELTDEQAAFVEAVGGFAARECGTRAQRDALTGHGQDPHSEELYAKVAELGWLGVAVGEEHDGSGGGMVDRCLFLETISHGQLPMGEEATGFDDRRPPHPTARAPHPSPAAGGLPAAAKPGGPCAGPRVCACVPCVPGGGTERTHPRQKTTRRLDFCTPIDAPALASREAGPRTAVALQPYPEDIVSTDRADIPRSRASRSLSRRRYAVRGR